MFKQEIDSVVEDFLKRDPKTIKAEELITETTKINSYKNMAENLGDENLPQYLLNAVQKIREHKNKGNLDKMKSMSPFVKVHDPRKPQIGTHN
ncbi:MAG: hypothetical protein WCX17_04100 [Parcubacteria group bacterium]